MMPQQPGGGPVARGLQMPLPTMLSPNVMSEGGASMMEQVPTEPLPMEMQ
jgi:hypothetical protein